MDLKVSATISLKGTLATPLKISGSAVESLFSQFKHNSGGKLDACNYATARCAHLVKQSIWRSQWN